MRVRITLKDDKGRELLWHDVENVDFGSTVHIDGIEFREQIKPTGELPNFSTVLWMEGSFDIEVLKR